MFLTVLTGFVIVNGCHGILSPECLDRTQCSFNLSQHYDNGYPDEYQNLTKSQNALHTALNDHFTSERNNVDVMEAVETSLIINAGKDIPKLNGLFRKVCRIWWRKLHWILMTSQFISCTFPQDAVLTKFLTGENFNLTMSTLVRECHHLAHMFRQTEQLNEKICQGTYRFNGQALNK